MVTDALLSLVFGLIDAAFFLLPDGSGIDIEQVGGYNLLAVANVVLPIDHALSLLGIAGAIMTVGLTYWVIMKALNLLRGSGA